MPFLWDTIWQNPAEVNLGSLADWTLADPDVEPDNVGGFQDTDPLATAMIIALYTDGKLPDEFVDQYGFTANDQHEWHGNTFDIIDNEEPLGSLLWTIERMPLNEETARIAEHYASEALQTLVKQKLVSYFDISSDIDHVRGRISLRIAAFADNGNSRSFVADLFPLR